MPAKTHTFTTDHGKLAVTSRVAASALHTGSTRVAGSVAGALHTYLLTPAGGWSETNQAWRALVDAVDAAGPRSAAWRHAESAAEHLVDAAIAAGWERHSSRREAA